MRKTALIILSCFLVCLSTNAQKNSEEKKEPLIPFVGVSYGGCVSNPFSFTAGIQQPVKKHIRVVYDVHYWNTDYECYCDDVYAKGHFTSLTPSVRLLINSGKRTGAGLFAGVGLGYMFAKDRGTEQSYTRNVNTDKMEVGDKITAGRWDFNSISPSINIGIGFRVARFPVSWSTVYYFAKDTKGWGAMAGGVGLTFGFRKIEMN